MPGKVPSTFTLEGISYLQELTCIGLKYSPPRLSVGVFYRQKGWGILSTTCQSPCLAKLILQFCSKQYEYLLIDLVMYHTIITKTCTSVISIAEH